MKCNTDAIVDSIKALSISLNNYYDNVNNDIKKLFDGSTKNIVRPTYDGRLESFSIGENENIDVCDIMPDIADVKVINGENPIEKTVVIVYFTDGTFEKAVCNYGDTKYYSCEQGISICITKKILSDITGNGSSVYNKIIKRAFKVKKENEKLEREFAEHEKQQKRKIEKNRKRKEKKKIKQEESEREKQIEIYKEAYLRAMRELHNSN